MKKSFVLAAGGLLERTSQSGTLIAIVGRTRYVDRGGVPGDWVLPKGKVEANETLEDAARREVLEETGCVGRIVGPSFQCEYVADGVPKVVTFFRMQCESEGPIRDASEVRTIRWLSPREAADNLTYELERDVVRRAYSTASREGG